MALSNHSLEFFLVIRSMNLLEEISATKLKLTWLPETDKLVKLQLLEFDYLIAKKVEEDEDFLDVLNPVTKETLAIGDANMPDLKHGEVIQLERKGYFICDVPFVRRSKPIVLFAIPGGNKLS